MIFLSPLHFLREAYLAVTDFRFYRAVFQQPLRRTLLYLLYLSAVAAVVLTVTYAWQYGPHFQRLSRWAQENFPPLEVKDGKLTVDAPQPLVMKFDGSRPISFVFDTTGAYSSPARLEEPAVLLTKDHLYFRYYGQTQTHAWKGLGSFRVGKEDLKEWERLASWAYFPLAYSSLLVYKLAAHAVVAIFLVPFGMLASAREAVRLPLGVYFTVALYSLTPALVIDLGVALTGLEISYFLLIYLATGALYTYLATQKCVVVE